MNMNRLLSFFYFFYFSIVGVYLIFMPKVLSELGYSPSEIGVVFSAMPLVRFILPFLFMKTLKLNHKIFNFALVLMLLSSVAFYLSINDFYLLVVSNIFFGIGLSLVLPYVEVIALSSIGKERYGKIRLFGSVGFVFVALVLVRILSSPEIPLAFLVVLTYLSAIFAYFVARLEYKKDDKIDAKSIDGINLLQDWKLWSGFVFMQLSFGSFYNFFTIYATDNGISMDTTIYLWSFGVLVEIVMFFTQARLLQKKLLFIVELSVLATAFRWFLLFAYPQNIEVLFFSQSIHALSFALFHSASISYLFYYYKNRPLAQQLFSGLSYGLGGLGGAFISGYIYEYYPKYLFLSSSFFALLALGFFMLWSRDVKDKYFKTISDSKI